MFATWAFSILCTISVPGQAYHQSDDYKADTAVYGQQVRRIFASHKRARAAGTLARPERFSYDNLAHLLYYYEWDTLRCVYHVDSYYMNVRWSTERTFSVDRHRSGKRRTSGEYLIIRNFYQEWIFPVNQHKLYRRNGTLQSVACFDNYGNPVRDSIFDKRGKFRKVRKLNMYYTELRNKNHD